MALDNAQKLIIKSWLAANATMLNDQEAAAALNATASPVFYVYRNFVSTNEILTNGFNWTLVDNLTQGKARIWEWMINAFAINQVQGLDFSNAGCRGGINETWKGTQAMIDQRDVIYTHACEAASVAGKLLATGEGTLPVNDGDGSGPATRGYYSYITAQDVVDSYNA